MGHGALLRRTVEIAKRQNDTSAVFTFDRSPKEVVTGAYCPLINSPEDRKDLLRRLYGIHDILMVPFDHEMMTTPWEEYITKILVGRYHAVHLVAGHDHHFGHKNLGSPDLLQKKCAELGLGCDIIPKVEIGGITVSSTYIRRLIELGQMERAMKYLGHPHTLSGTVCHGRSLGHACLFPTINLPVPFHVLTPSNGVYCSRVYLPDGTVLNGVTNIGTRPTVNNGTDVTVETFLLDFKGDLYGCHVRLEFYKRLRDEKLFDSLDELKAQIQEDAKSCRAYFSGMREE